MSHIFISCMCTYVHIYNSSYTEAPIRHRGEQSWTQLVFGAISPPRSCPCPNLQTDHFCLVSGHQCPPQPHISCPLHSSETVESGLEKTLWGREVAISGYFYLFF